MEEGKIPEHASETLDARRFPALDLLRPPLQLRSNDVGLVEVFDLLRKKWIVLKPEEWVRQHIVYWLLQQSGYPAGLLSLERGLENSGMRTDVLGYNREGKPLLLVECKEPDVDISAETLTQAIKYNQLLKARFIWLSNGLRHQVLELDEKKQQYKKHAMLPHFNQMISA